MKIQILSDLHVEFGDFRVPETGADVVVFAGDIGVGLEGLEWIVGQAMDRPVIYVMGNHEYYTHDINLIGDIRASAPDNIHVLENDAVEINGVRFLGCTLWTDFKLYGEANRIIAIPNAGEHMTDFKVINNGRELYTPEDSIALHEYSRRWLHDELAKPYDGKTVVVTHHLPSFKSVPERYQQDLLSAAFASHLDELMDAERAALWIHGHTHTSFDYEINGTRVVCNPRGYFGHELNEEFQPDLVVEV